MADIETLFTDAGYEDPANFTDISFEFQFPDFSEEDTLENTLDQGGFDFGFAFLMPDGSWFEGELPEWVEEIFVEVAETLQLDLDTNVAENTLYVSIGEDEGEESLTEMAEAIEGEFTKLYHRKVKAES